MSRSGWRAPLSSRKRHAVAIDLGTTTIAAALVELDSGRTAARSGCLNPQRRHGLDVVARLEYACRSAANRAELQRLVNGELCRLVTELAESAGIDPAGLEQVAIAGNPTMSHLLLGLPVESLAHPPYRPRSTGSHRVSTADLGWPVQIPAYVFPSPGGFVGGDTVAFLYGLGINSGTRGEERGTRSGERGARTEAGEFEEYVSPRTSNLEPRTCLYLDLGTNGEMVLLAGGKLLATSAAAGPAFEAGNLSCGMAALPGAIDSVAIEEGRLTWTTVAGARPVGVCGSGVLDAIAMLLQEGVMDGTGRLLAPNEVDSPLGSRLAEIDGERHFVLYRDAAGTVSLSQGDVRQVQLAKGAVRAGIEVLLANGGVKAGDLAEVVLTGSFGAALRLQSLKSIGVLTENMVINARFVREGALAGVIRYLIDARAAETVERLASGLRIMPLSGTPAFERYFLEQMDFHK